MWHHENSERPALMQTFLKVKNRTNHRLLKSIASTFGLRITYTGLTFCTSVLLARLLGASGFGMYVYAYTCTYLLGVIAPLGLDNLMVREVALYKSQGSWALMKGLLRRADQIVFLVSVGIGLLAIGAAWYAWHATNWSMFLVFCVAMLGLPPAALRNLRRGTMDGLSRVVLGFLPESVIDPALLILLTGIAALILRDRLTALVVIGIYSFTTLVTLMIGAKICNDSVSQVGISVAPQYQTQKWLQSAIPFMFLGGLTMISNRIDILMLGAFKGVAVSGLYVPVNRAAILLTFVPMAVRRVLAPQIAQSYGEGKINEIKKTVAKSSWMIFIATCPLVLLLIGLSHWYLLLFGQDFLAGRAALIILCCGQFLRSLTGLSDTLLNMAGFESYMAWTSFGSVSLNVCLNALLVPQWGLEGAAIATATSLVGAAVGSAILVRRKLGINATILPGALR